MTLGEAHSVWSDDERDMHEARRFETKRLVDEQLSRCGVKQVVATDYLRNAHSRVVDTYGEHIARVIHVAGEREVASEGGDVLPHMAGEGIIELRGFARADTETPHGDAST